MSYAIFQITCATKLFAAYLKFKFNWIFYIFFPGNLVSEGPSSSLKAQERCP